MGPSPDTRLSLILRLSDPADADAWRDFVSLYEPLIYQLARRKGLQDADARDLCQEVLLAVAHMAMVLLLGKKVHQLKLT